MLFCSIKPKCMMDECLNTDVKTNTLDMSGHVKQHVLMKRHHSSM